MSKIRESIVSNSEKKFVLKAINEWKRIDGRAFQEFRDLKIKFGKDWGCCHVCIGDTRVLAQVSCEIQQPKSSRPSEGLLNINVELNPIAAPNFEAGRQSDLSVQLNRLLEKGLKDSKALDLESLCIKVNEKVWAFRIDINVLNHEGNILDAASVAALAALAHFRRPDVTFEGEDFVIHTYEQRDPIPTVIHHYPVYISNGVFNNGETVLADPTLLEENVAEAQLSLGLNAYKEVCGIHLGGSAAMNIDAIIKATSSAANRAKSVIEQIKKCVEEDNLQRQEKKEIGLQHTLSLFPNDDKTVQEELSECLDKWNFPKKKKQEKTKKGKKRTREDEFRIEQLGKNSASLVPQDDEQNKWLSDDDEKKLDTIPNEPTPEARKKNKKKNKNKHEPMDTNSEEEETIILNSSTKGDKKKKRSKCDQDHLRETERN